MRAVPPSDKTSDDSFAYARDLATYEIGNIERLHNRTLKYLSGFATAFAAIGFLLGYIGYRNLSQTIQIEVKRQVDTKIRGKLETANVEVTIRKILRERSEDQIRGIVREQVTRAVVPEVTRQLQSAVALAVRENSAQLSSLIHSEVVAQVKQQTPLIKSTTVTETQRIAQQRFTYPPNTAFPDVTAYLRDGAPGKVQIVTAPTNPSSMRGWFAALNAAGWIVTYTSDSSAIGAGPQGSLTIVEDPKHPSESGMRLRTALRSLGFQVALARPQDFPELRITDSSIPVLMINMRSK